MRTNHRRHGFTLVELLVVIGIIAVLAAMAVGVSIKVVDSQHQANTETAIRTVMQTVNQHWNDVVEKAGKEPPSGAAIMLAAGDKNRAQAIHTKFRLMEAFPSTFKEVQQPCYVNDPNTGAAVKVSLPLVYVPPVYVQGKNLVANTDWTTNQPVFPWAWVGGGPLIDKNQRYMSSFQKKVKSMGTGTPNADEAAALLLMTLSMDKGGARRLDADTLGKSFVQDKSIGGNTYPCMVDDWGNSLMFYRFPTGNADGLNSLGTTPPLDRIDKFRSLLNANWFNSPYPPPTQTPVTTLGNIFSSLVHPVNSSVTGGPASSPVANGVLTDSFIIPALVSAGRDGQFGLNPDLTMTVGNSTQASDNIYSFRLLLGAGTQ